MRPVAAISVAAYSSCFCCGYFVVITLSPVEERSIATSMSVCECLLEVCMEMGKLGSHGSHGIHMEMGVRSAMGWEWDGNGN